MSKENTAVTKKKIKRCKEDVVFDAACFIILTLVLFVVAYRCTGLSFHPSVRQAPYRVVKYCFTRSDLP